MQKRIHTYPKCAEGTSKVHDYREQIIKDVSSFGQITYLHLSKRRHVCPSCGKKFYEAIDFLPRYHTMTHRLAAFIISEFEHSQSMAAIAKRTNVSGPTVARIFDYIQHPLPALPQTIGIDEFRGNAGGERFQCILTDPEKRRTLDILPDRKAETLYRYFSSFENRKGVRYVVMDMSNHFRTIIKTCFPKATIIADPFHVVRQVCWAMENVRKEEQKKFSGNRRKYFKRSRKLLLKHYEDLSEEQRERVSVMLDTSERLSRAYGLPEFKSCIAAITNWSREFLSAWVALIGSETESYLA